jgi:LysM repeat protein
MKKFSIRCALLVLSGITSIYSVKAHPTFPIRETVIDSIGVEKKDGKRFILHRVDEGQTLYALARKYHRSVAAIKAANPDIKESVKYSQIVRIPMPDGASKPKETKVVPKQEKVGKLDTNQKAVSKPASEGSQTAVTPKKSAGKEQKKAEDPARAGIHVVETGQTLYSLASRYGVSQEDLRKWNNLPGNNVLIGQALIVSEKAHQARVPSKSMAKIAAKTPDKVPEPAPKTVAVHPAEPRPGEPKPSEPRSTTPAAEPHVTEPKVTPPISEQKPERRSDVSHNEADAVSKPSSTSASTKPAEVEIESPRPGNDAPMPTHGRRISDSGIAEMIEGADGSGKYLALHRTAPIGTLVQVRNAFNNQSLWVKVIGRLPNTGINDKILIKLSTQAFSKLSPEDRRFRAEVSYIVR